MVSDGKLKKLALVGLEDWSDGRILDGDLSLDPDRRFSPIKELRDRLLEKGIQLVHYSKVPFGQAWGYFFVNYDWDEKFLKKLLSHGYAGKLFLLIIESKVISPKNWIPENHRPFDAVFTWDMRPLPKTEKPLYIRYFFPSDLSAIRKPVEFSRRKKLAVMVASNKWKRRPQELYSKRFRAIEWFMENHREDFDLWGSDWTYGPFNKKIEGLKNLIRRLQDKPTRPLDVQAVYKGPAVSKGEVLKDYKFCICFENAIDIPGYITEKIFDCFLAGTVPVYLGWEGVKDFIPKEAFLDFREFSGFPELYLRLSSMDEDAFMAYVERGQRFITDGEGARFSPESFGEVVSSGIGNFLG